MFANRRDLVEALVTDMPFIMKWLEDLGVTFDKNPEGNYVEVSGGGACRRRLHCARDYTGLEILRILRKKF